MKKRILIFALLLAMAVSITGCFGQTTSTDDGELSITMMVINDSGSTNDDNYMIKKIFKEKFNIDVKLNQNIANSHFEKLRLLTASNELPDIVSPLPIDDAKNIGPKGALVAIDEYLDTMPNLANRLKTDEVAYTSMLAADSHIYGAPKFNERPEFMNTPIIRADMVKAVGMEIPKTMSELIDTLRAIKAKYPNVVGVVNRNKEAALRGYGIMYNTAADMMYNNETDKWEYGPLNAGYKEMITDLNTLYNENLLDKEFFTASMEQWEEKLLNNLGVFTLDWPNRAQVEEDMYKKLNPNDTEFDLELMMPLTTESSQKMRILQSETVASYSSYGISSRTKNVERLLKAIDYLYSDEGARLLQWGEENTHYTMENGQKRYMEHISVAYNPDATEKIEATEGINAPHILRVVKDDGLNIFPQEVQDMSVRYRDEVECFETNYKIKLNFTPEQLDRIRVLNNNITTLVLETSVKMILNTTPISEYDSFISQMENNGARELEEIYAEAYELFKTQLNEVN